MTYEVQYEIPPMRAIWTERVTGVLDEHGASQAIIDAHPKVSVSILKVRLVVADKEKSQ